ncbi:hypothetical protein PsorP6_013653 [Peronosclerospora sorghi]|uniref:Uncharacterized protein n=1 Tax=Peronosclerospora sorghi TaxID=230839 RepID=A0ACC0VI08_9STRA|nr:hypothetical protein PsorP6_013653 [Peronosclerospora sorghi]
MMKWKNRYITPSLVLPTDITRLVSHIAQTEITETHLRIDFLLTDDSDDDDSDAESNSSMDLPLDESEAADLAEKRVSMRHLLKMIPDVEVSRRDIPFHLSMVRRRCFDDLTTDTTKIPYIMKIVTFKDAHDPLRSPNPIEELPIPTLQTLPAT